MSKLPEPSLPFAAWNTAWPQEHGAANIRGQDLWVIAVILIIWLAMISLMFGGLADGAATSGSKEAVHGFSSKAKQSLYASFSGYVCAIIGLVALGHWRGLSAASVLLNRFQPQTLVASIVTMFAVFFIVVAFQVEAFRQPGGEAVQKLIAATREAQTSDALHRSLFWFIVIVLKPLAFQLLFRGWLFAWLRMRMSFWFAALIASLLYAAAQLTLYDFFIAQGAFSGAALIAVGYVFFGYVSCALTEYSRSLWPGYWGDVIVFGIIF